MNREFLDNLRAEMSGNLLLGRGAETGRNRYLSLDDLKRTSIHIVGASGFGKSFFLRHLVDQLVIQKQPFGVIDPHTELYQYAIWRLRRANVSPAKLILVDPLDPVYSLGFNPLSCGVHDPSEAASLVMEAFLKAWGAQSFDQTPRLESILRGMLRLLIENDLTLFEGPEFLDVDNGAFRQLLLDKVQDRIVRQEWQEFEKLPRSEKLVVVESSRNRLRRFLHSARLQLMLAQRGNTLNFKNVLDDGQYLLANLGGVAPETKRLIGALLVNGLFHAAKLRNSRKRRAWFLICDEFGQYATHDFANSLDELRKFGLHLTLAHQRLNQIQREDPDILSAVMTNAKIKVVFGGLERPEAEMMARELFTGEVSGSRIKHISVATKFRPVLDTFTVESETSTSSESESRGDGTSQGRGAGNSESEDWALDAFIGGDRVLSVSTSEQSSSSQNSSRGSSTSRGRSSSNVPITRHEEFKEETSRQFYSIEEEWERVISRVHRLATRQAIIKVYNGPVIEVTTQSVEPEKVNRRLEQYRVKALTQCPHVKTVVAVVVEVEERRKELAARTEAKETDGRPIVRKSFRE